MGISLYNKSIDEIVVIERDEFSMSNRKIQKVVVYCMLFAMLTSTLLIGIASFL